MASEGAKCAVVTPVWSVYMPSNRMKGAVAPPTSAASRPQLLAAACFWSVVDVARSMHHTGLSNKGIIHFYLMPTAAVPCLCHEVFNL